MLLLAQILVAVDGAVHRREGGRESSALASSQLASHQVRGVLVYGREPLAVRAPRGVKRDEENLMRANHPFERGAGYLVRYPPVAVVVEIGRLAVLWLPL